MASEEVGYYYLLPYCVPEQFQYTLNSLYIFVLFFVLLLTPSVFSYYSILTEFYSIINTYTTNF
uniref:Uncharacterized protein n=1 Tax=Lepeophtheirus salmonis TaxID=72036 RepID=A0A0K2T6T6_LEPSM